VRTTLILAALLVGSSAAASPLRQSAPLRVIERMMVSLRPESARASAAIKDAYRDHLELLVLDEFSDLEGALATGGVAPLPEDAALFNLMPRLDGAHPIGEKDPANQPSYVAARPATIGCLLEVASRVKSGPVEVSSLVRHGDYQNALRATNINATTSVPVHTMGLAFDIALINSSLETVYEIRDVLRRMRDDGDLMFIAERQQLVFHVVPHPSRLGHFTEVYMRHLGAPPAVQYAEVIASAPVASRELYRGPQIPRVTAEIVAVVPAEGEVAPEWLEVERKAGGNQAISASASSVRGAWLQKTGNGLMVPSIFAQGCMAMLAACLGTVTRLRERHASFI
jgi:hypothetical protein